MTIKKKTAILMTAAVLVIGVAGWLILYGTERRDCIEDTRSELTRYLNFMAAAVESGGLDQLEKLSTLWTTVYEGGRATIISGTGKVLLDTGADVENMENHYTRREVLGALASGEGSELRYSSTQDQWMIYSAKRIDPADGSDIFVVRLAYPVRGLSGLVQSVTVPFLKYFLALILLVWLVTYFLLRTIMTPLAELSHSAERIAHGEEVRFPIKDDGEIKALSDTLNYMQDSLRESIHEAQDRRRELSQLIGALPVGVILIDDAKKIRYINKEAASICGIHGFVRKGTAIESILPSEGLMHMLDEADATKPFTIMRSGGTLHLEATTLVLPRGRLMMIQDLTEKMQLEEVRRDFFIDAGHEFRTPLAIIRTGLELLAGEPEMATPERAEDAHTIQSLLRQQERMSGLVDDLLLLVRLDSAPLQRNMEDTDLSEIVEDVAAEVSALPQDKPTRIEVEVPEDGAYVSAVPADLRRAVLNVVENAHKYIVAGRAASGLIKLTIETDEDDDDMWRLTVDDNGPGVADNERELIFERFRRGDSHRARGGKKVGGYGLGLSISRRIIERHGGTLELGESNLGGAAFVTKLPKATPHQDDEEVEIE